MGPVTTETNGAARVSGWAITALLSIVLTGGTVIWSIQREQLQMLRQDVNQLQREVGMLQGTDGLSQLDRSMLHERVADVEVRQGRVIGVLSTLAPNATASILRSER